MYVCSIFVDIAGEIQIQLQFSYVVVPSRIPFSLLIYPKFVAAQFILKVIDTEAFKSINLTYIAEPDPACSEFTFLTDDYWKCKVQQETISWIHMVGTCRLGPDTGDSTTSVVDTKFRFVLCYCS